jgi:hypothetical protein
MKNFEFRHRRLLTLIVDTVFWKKWSKRIRRISRWQTRGSADGHEEGVIQRNMPDGKYGGGGSIYD